MDTNSTHESVYFPDFHSKPANVRENISSLLGQTKLSIISRCHYQLGVHIAGFHHIQIIYYKTLVNKVIIKLSLFHYAVLYNMKSG